MADLVIRELRESPLYAEVLLLHRHDGSCDVLRQALLLLLLQLLLSPGRGAW